MASGGGTGTERLLSDVAIIVALVYGYADGGTLVRPDAFR